MIPRVVRGLLERHGAFGPILQPHETAGVTYTPGRDESLTGFVIPSFIASHLTVAVHILRDDEHLTLLSDVPAVCFVERSDCRLPQHRMQERDKYEITFTNVLDAPVRLIVAGLVDQP